MYIHTLIDIKHLIHKYYIYYIILQLLYYNLNVLYEDYIILYLPYGLPQHVKGYPNTAVDTNWTRIFKKIMLMLG